MSKWDMVRLGDVFSKQITGEWGIDCFDNEVGTFVLRTTNFRNNGEINFENIAVRNISDSKVTKKKLQFGDIILEKSGGTENISVGRVVFCDSRIEEKIYLCNNFTQAMRPNASLVHSKYLFYHMFNLHRIGFTNLMQNKTTGIRNLQTKRYLDTKLPLPPLEEQKKIAQELDSIQSLIAKRKQQLEKMDLLVKAKFVEMFGDPVANPMGWEVKPLKQTTTITTGNTPPKNDIENYGNHIEWIKTDNITENMFLTSATEYLSEKGAKRGRLVGKNTILMACIAGSIKSIGRVAITDRNVSFNQQINAITPKKSIYNIYFLYYLCIFNQKYIQSNISMSLKGILSKGRLEQIEFVVPPIELQNHFADYVQQTETLKTTMHSGLEKLELLYNSKMQEYFG